MYQYLPTDSKHIMVCGRTKVQNPLPVFWTASGIEFRTCAGEVWVTLEAEYDHKEIWIQVEVDGFLLQRILLPRGKQNICLFREFPEDHCKTIKLIQSAQPFQDDKKRLLLIHEVNASKPLEEVLKKPVSIEVIGDSLSSGEGLSGTADLTGWSAGLFGLSGHYARRIADYFDADLRVISQSGWGVYCAWDNNIHNRIPDYYHQICGLAKGEKQVAYGSLENYDFSSWTADVVIINLGTNDGNGTVMEPWTDPETGMKWKLWTNEDGTLTEEAKSNVENAVSDFIKQVRKGNPKAHIIWAYGMCGYLISDYLKEAFDRYVTESNDKNAEFVLLPEMKQEQSGSNHHPGALDHKASAEVLIQQIDQYFQNKM